MRLVVQFILNGLGARSERDFWNLANLRRAAIAPAQPQLRSTNESRAHNAWRQCAPSFSRRDLFAMAFSSNFPVLLIAVLVRPLVEAEFLGYTSLRVRLSFS
jgi:hypothetical protein